MMSIKLEDTIKTEFPDGYLQEEARPVTVEEKLILAVAKQPAIYDFRAKGHKDHHRKDIIWATISKELSLEGGVCKKKWRNLRDRYIRERRVQREKSLSGIDYRPVWKHFGIMNFLEPFTHERRVIDSSLVSVTVGDPLSISAPEDLPYNDGDMPDMSTPSSTVSSSRSPVSTMGGTPYSPVANPPMMPQILATSPSSPPAQRQPQLQSQTEAAATPQKSATASSSKGKKRKLCAGLDAFEVEFFQHLKVLAGKPQEKLSPSAHFLRSLEPLLEKVPDSKRAEVQIEILNILNQAIYPDESF